MVKETLVKVNEQQVHSVEKESKSSKASLSGNVLFFASFDVGDIIDIQQIREKKILKASDMDPFPHFKNYHVPLVIDIDELSEKKSGATVMAKIHNFGVVSLNYIIPYNCSFEALKHLLIDSVDDYSQIAKKDAKKIFDQINFCIKEPSFYNGSAFYHAVQNEYESLKINNTDLIKKFGHEIVSLLKLERKKMAEDQIEEVLEQSTAYYGSDLIIISSEGAFIYDDDYYEPLEFLELVNIQKLELQCYDKVLDKKLNAFYNLDRYKIPASSYIPLLGSRIDMVLEEITKLKVDISVITERLRNSVNMTNDSYFQNLYSMLVEAFKLNEWKSSIDEKMSIISEVYSLRRNQHETIRNEVLTIVIIVFIALETFFAFLKI